MLTAWGIRKFLLRQPRASLIRLTSGDKTHDIVPKRNQSWSKVGESIAAVAPELIECLDAQGNLIRAIRPQVDSDPNDAPDPPSPLVADPETARITHIANLIHRAYEHSTNVAFNKLCELYEVQAAHSQSIEARLERTEANYRRLMQQQLNDAFVQAEELAEQSETGDGDMLTQLGKAFLQGKDARTNGKG